MSNSTICIHTFIGREVGILHTAKCVLALISWIYEEYFGTDDKMHCSSNTAYPLVIAGHPSEPNQIAVGMSDGSVHVVEPCDVEMKWGNTASHSQDNGPLPSNSSNPSLTAQPSDLPSR